MASRILVIDDEPLIQRVIQAMLHEYGYVVDGVLTCAQAEQMLATTSYCGMMVDYNLPVEDGISFVRRLQQQNVYIPTIIISGQDYLTVQARASDLAVSACLAKPFDMNVLIATVQQAFGAAV
ncbi:MAG: response regulator [Herpetosiphonaceae bacterium]|nr:response regulator [Herpetosiphonaceae bacterium]